MEGRRADFASGSPRAPGRPRTPGGPLRTHGLSVLCSLAVHAVLLAIVAYTPCGSRRLMMPTPRLTRGTAAVEVRLVPTARTVQPPRDHPVAEASRADPVPVEAVLFEEPQPLAAPENSEPAPLEIAALDEPPVPQSLETAPPEEPGPETLAEPGPPELPQESALPAPVAAMAAPPHPAKPPEPRAELEKAHRELVPPPQVFKVEVDPRSPATPGLEGGKSFISRRHGTRRRAAGAASEGWSSSRSRSGRTVRSAW